MCARLMPIRSQILLVCMVMRNIQILLAPRVGLDSSSLLHFADCPVFWQSKLQTETALLTIEAEIIALSACCRELFPIMDMVSSVTKSVKLPIGRTTMNVAIHEDNSVALVLAKTLPPQFTPRSKYYAIKTIWFCEEIFKRDVQLHKIDTVEQLGDIFTKVLTHFVFEYLRKKIMGW